MVQIFFDRGKNIVGKGENVLKKTPFFPRDIKTCSCVLKD